MNDLVVQSLSADQTQDIGRVLGELLIDGDVVLLQGDLGAGKTCFSQGVGKGMGIDDDIVSPTFNILIDYVDGAVALHHFDLYRLDDPEELEDIDFYYIVDADSEGASLIEWASRFPAEMPEEFLEVNIGRGGADVPDSRTIAFSAAGDRAIALCELLAKRLDEKIG